MSSFAVYFTGIRKMEVREEKIPVMREHQVLVQTHCSAISSGTEMLFYHGLVPQENRTRNAYQIGVVYGQRSQLDWDLPLIDSFVTVAAVLTTWMVANKLLENWVYWFVIDSISIYLYLSQGLLLYAGLFVVYVILVVIGFLQWRAELVRLQAAGPAGALQ